MRIQVDHEILAQKFNRTWQDHNGQSVIELTSQDAIYRLYPPRGELHLESGIWTVLIEQEYDRSASTPDFCAVRLYFDEEGKVASGAALYRQGDGRQLPGVVIDITSELLDYVGLPEVAVLIELAGKVIDYILGNIGDWSDGGGRPNFMAVVGHDLARVRNSLVYELDRVWLYEHADFKGLNQSLGPGNYDMESIKIGNDRVSSVEMPDGWSVTLYANENFGGASSTLTSSTTDLEDFNDRASSIKVLGPDDRVIIYRDMSCKGPSQDLFAGHHDSNALTLSKRVSSLWVPKGWTATLYDQPGFTGNTVVAQAGTTNLNNFNDRTQSIHVKGAAS